MGPRAWLRQIEHVFALGDSDAIELATDVIDYVSLEALAVLVRIRAVSVVDMDRVIDRPKRAIHVGRGSVREIRVACQERLTRFMVFGVSLGVVAGIVEAQAQTPGC